MNLDELKTFREELTEKIEIVDRAIRALEELEDLDKPKPSGHWQAEYVPDIPAGGKPKHHTMSEAAKQAIRKAQKARWRKWRKARKAVANG